MEKGVRIEELEKTALELKMVNKELSAKCQCLEDQLRNVEEQLRHIGDYKTAFKLLVAELKESRK